MLLLILCAAFAPVTAAAQDSGQRGPLSYHLGPDKDDEDDAARPGTDGGRFEKIAAVVNDEAISLSDVRARERLILLSSRLPDNEDIRQRMRERVVSVLIDEQIQLQEAEEMEIEIPPQVIDRGYSQLAGRNDMSAAEFRSFLQENNVPLHTVERQVRAQYAWSQVVQARVRPRVQISQSDIDSRMARIRAKDGVTQYQLAEIVLPVQNPEQERKVAGLADRLVQEMRTGNAPFPSVARQFSRAPSAARGGMKGWVSEDDLGADLRKVVTEMTRGQLSRPIRHEGEYVILYLKDKRVVNSPDSESRILNIKRLILPASMDPEAANSLARSLTGCLDIRRKAGEDETYSLDEWKDVAAGDLNEDLARRLKDADIGTALSPFRLETGAEGTQGPWAVYMVCGRTRPESNMPGRSDISQSLGMERVDKMQQRLLNDLRAAAFIERRV